MSHISNSAASLVSLQGQLEDTRTFLKERVVALLQDREIREKDEEARALNDANRIQEIQKKLKVSYPELRCRLTTDCKTIMYTCF